MKKKNCVVFLLVCIMLLPNLMLFVSAETVTAKVLTTTTQLTSGTLVSGWGTPTIDGAKDGVYQDYSLLKGNFDYYNTDASVDVWYANDGDYLYFYVDGATPFDKTKKVVGGNDYVELIVDFYNQHTQIYNAQNNAYMTANFGGAAYNGGRYAIYPVSGGVEVVAFGAVKGTQNVDFIGVLRETKQVGDAYSCRYSVEARVPLPDYIKTAISSGQQPIIGACLRASTSGPASCVMTFDSEMFGPNNSGNSYTNNVSKDFTLIPDLVLSNSTAGNRTVLFEKKVSNAISDVNEKTVTVDGVKDEAEGWSELPTAYLSDWTANLKVNNGNPLTAMSGFTPRVWISADDDFLYFFYETANLNAFYTTFQIGFGNTATALSKGLFTEIRIKMQKNNRGTPYLGEFQISNKTSYVNFRSEYSGGVYQAGDALYDDVAFMMKGGEARNVIELKVPIPDAVKGTQLQLKMNIFERKEASTGASGYGYFTEPGFGWNIEESHGTQTGETLEEWIESTKKQANYSSLGELTVYTFGDSYLKGNGLPEEEVWPALLATKYHWTYSNNGVNGNMLSGYQSADSMPMYKRYQQLSNNAPDLLIMDGGRNDYNHSVPLGTLDSEDPDTFMGALNVLMKGLRKKYPDTAMVFTTVWNFPNTNPDTNLTYLDYAKATELVCQKWGVYCFKAYDPEVSGVDMRSQDFRSENCMYDSDISHLNLTGMKLVMPTFESYLNECMNDWNVNKDRILAQVAENTAPKTEATEEEKQPTGTTEEPMVTSDEKSEEEEKFGCGSSLKSNSFWIVILLLVISLRAFFPKSREQLSTVETNFSDSCEEVVK